MRVVGRLAPSPTGAQHVGNARTYLLAWLSARSQGGSVRLRIEDIDSPRVKSGADLQAIEDLKWLGLDWDDEITVQSARPAPYLEALQHLRQRETVYACTCTRSDVERAASAPHLEHEGPVYPGTCSKRSARDIPDTPHCWRFRIPPETPSFEDAYQGHCRINLQQVGGDFVVWKSAQNPAYQLAVVVDDAASGVTEVVRGDDLIPSTPRQLLLYRALGLTPPQFAHVPLVVGMDGRRLAKRHGDTRLSSLREAGVCPALLVGLLAWSCGWYDRIEPTTPRELLSVFTFKTLPQQPFILSPQLLARIGYS